MRTRSFPCLLPICILLFACGPTASRGSADAVTFDTAGKLDDFDFAVSGDGGPDKWSAVDKDASRGLAQIGIEVANSTFADACKVGLWTKADSVTLFDQDTDGEAK